MAAKILLDTGVLIAAERGKLRLGDAVAPADDIAIAVVTAAELQIGVEQSDDAHRQQRRRFLQRLVEQVPVIDYTLPIALAHAKIAATLSGRGVTRARPDLMIAATALVSGRVLVTLDEGLAAVSGLKLQHPAG